MHVQGNKWITFNDMTQICEFLCLKEWIRASYEQSWKLQTDMESSAEADVKTPAKLTKALEPLRSPSKPNKRQKTGEEGKDKEKEPHVKRQSKKQLDAGFSKLKDLKARMANAHAVATDILRLCQKGPKWEWVSGKTSESLQKVL